MSTPQWQNLPVPPTGGQGWASFTADPRNPQYQVLRASDADRGNASAMLADAYAEGRVNKDEYDQRLSQVMSAKSLGELVPVLNDLTVDPTVGPSYASTANVPERVDSRSAMLGPFPRWWLGLALLFNVIWLLTSVSSGHPLYYWPMWPMLGTGIPVILGLINGGYRRNPAPPRNHQLPPSSGQDLR